MALTMVALFAILLLKFNQKSPLADLENLYPQEKKAFKPDPNTDADARPMVLHHKLS